MVANGLEGVPWMIGGGSAKHSANAGRLVAYAATGGTSGVIQPGDLKVSASQPTPDGKVHMATGAVAIVNRASNAQSESYLARGTQVSDLDISPTGGATRSDLVVVRIKDPQYGWAAPADAVNGPYGFPEIIPGVPSNTTRAEDLNLNQALYAVARIDMPANTSAVQQGFVKDLRRLAHAHYDVFNQLTAGPEPAEWMLVSDSDWKNWPSTSALVTVPPWATWADVTIGLNGISTDGPADINTRVNFGGLIGDTYFLDYNGAPGTPAGFVEALNHDTMGSFDVRSLAGKTVTLRLNAKRTYPVNTGNIGIGAGGQVRMRVEFFERVV